MQINHELDKELTSKETPLNSSSALKIFLIAFLLLILYYPIIKFLVQDWDSNPNYSHGYIVPFITAYLVWERRKKLALIKPSPTASGIFLLLAGVLTLFLGHIGAELFLQRFSIILVINGLVLFLLGCSYFKTLLFPISFLIFMVPLPATIFNTIAFPLQLLAANVSTVLISTIGIPVFRDGNIIQLAGITLEVAEACSGIRSLITILTLATIYSYFMEKRRWKQLILVFSSLPIAIVTNSARVTLTAILAHYFGASAADGFYHTFEGWFMFVVAFGILLLLGYVIRKVFP